MPIAIKFAVFITGLVVVFMGIVTYTSMKVVEEDQEAGVNKSGVRLICTLTAALAAEWVADGMDRNRLEDVLHRVMQDTRNQGILNALVYNTQDELLATGRRENLILVSRDERRIESKPAESAGVEILEFLYDGKPIRSFGRPITTDGSLSGESIVGRAELLLSATQIQQSRDEMRRQMINVSALICLLAALGSFVLAGLFAHPIRTLMKDLRQVSLGDLEHKSKVRTTDELGDLARTFNQMTDNLRKAQEILLARKATEHELQLATRIQEHLLPSSVPSIPGLEIASFYKSAREIGGDYYDFLRVDAEHLGVVVADVSGKGVPGSLVMTMTRSLLRLAAKGQTSAQTTVRQVNRALSLDINPGMFVTLLYLLVHIPTRRVQLIRAGHNSPLLLRAGSDEVVPISPRGIALGLDRTGRLFDGDLEASEFTLKSGDLLVAFTDGVVEAKNATAQDYSEARLVEVIRANSSRHPREVIEAVLMDVRAHARKTEQSDDITLIAMKNK